jgi:hypothetical protein
VAAALGSSSSSSSSKSPAERRLQRLCLAPGGTGSSAREWASAENGPDGKPRRARDNYTFAPRDIDRIERENLQVEIKREVIERREGGTVCRCGRTRGLRELSTTSFQVLDKIYAVKPSGFSHAGRLMVAVAETRAVRTQRDRRAKGSQLAQVRPGSTLGRTPPPEGQSEGGVFDVECLISRRRKTRAWRRGSAAPRRPWTRRTGRARWLGQVASQSPACPLGAWRPLQMSATSKRCWRRARRKRWRAGSSGSREQQRPTAVVPTAGPAAATAAGSEVAAGEPVGGVAGAAGNLRWQ